MTNTEHLTVLAGGPTTDERETRLADGADHLADKLTRGSILGHPRLLLAVAAGLMTTGLSAIVVGWYGAAKSTLVEEQMPYLISGGLLGVALSTIGALTLFTHWLTVMIREARAHEASRQQSHQELMDALRSLAAPFGRQEDINGRARGAKRERPLRPASRSS